MKKWILIRGSQRLFDLETVSFRSFDITMYQDMKGWMNLTKVYEMGEEEGEDGLRLYMFIISSGCCENLGGHNASPKRWTTLCYQLTATATGIIILSQVGSNPGPTNSAHALDTTKQLWVTLLSYGFFWYSTADPPCNVNIPR